MGMRPTTKQVRRPKKTGTDRRRREKTQRKRLVGLGVPEAVVAKLNAKAVRNLLKRPAIVKKIYSR